MKLIPWASALLLGLVLMFGAALGIIAALTVYRGGRTIETREAVTA